MESKLPSSTYFELKRPLFDFYKKESSSPYKLFITQDAKNFVKKVDKIIASGEVPKDQLYWKELLADLYEFIGDSARTI